MRKKLDDEGDRIQHDIGEYGTFSQSIIELTKIVSEGMTFIKAPKSALKPKDIASPSVSLPPLSVAGGLLHVPSPADLWLRACPPWAA